MRLSLLFAWSALHFAPAMTVVRVAAGRRYNVFLENNNSHPRDYVRRVLMFVCEISESEASYIVGKATDNWMSLCGTWEQEIAQHHFECLQRKGLSVAMTPAEVVNDEDEDDCDPRPRYPDGTIIEEESDLPRWYQ